MTNSTTYWADITTHAPQVENSMPSATVSFSAPIINNADIGLDINSYLIKRPASTFFMRADDNDMKNWGINKGDLLVVDRSLTAVNKSIVIVSLNGELLIKKILMSSHTTYLTPWETRSTLFKVSPDYDFELWGVVAYNIHKL